MFALLTFGQTLFCIGVWYDTYWLMYIGRLLYGAGNECASVSQFVLVKLFVPEKNVVIIFGLTRLVSRGSLSLGVMVFSYFYHLNDSFTIPLISTIVSCVLSMVFYITYFEIQRRKESYKVNNIVEYPFQWSELKNFSIRAYMLLVMCCTIYSIYWSFQSMMTQALQIGLG